MSFWLKKILSQLVMPVPFILILLILAVIFWHRFGKILVISSIVLFAALSSRVVSGLLAGSLEQAYPVNNQAIIGSCVVMVLGSGHDDHLAGPATQQLSPTAMMRLSEGIRQWHKGEHCLLITSGALDRFDKQSHADVMAQAAMQFGVPKDRIVRLTLPKDTIEEAQYVKHELAKRALDDVPFRLITSASHMPRAMDIFHQAGLQPQAAPVDFRQRTGPWWVFNADNLLTSQRAIHEYIGRLWFWIKSHLVNW